MVTSEPQWRLPKAGEVSLTLYKSSVARIFSRGTLSHVKVSAGHASAVYNGVPLDLGKIHPRTITNNNVMSEIRGKKLPSSLIYSIVDMGPIGTADPRRIAVTGIFLESPHSRNG